MKASRTSRHRRSTAASICKFNAFDSMRWTVSGKSTQSDLFVDDHWRHHFPTRSGSIDRNHPNKSPPNSCRNSQFHKQKCLKGIDTFRLQPYKIFKKRFEQCLNQLNPLHLFLKKFAFQILKTCLNFHTINIVLDREIKATIC